MKKAFHGYYRLSKKEMDALWKDGLIVPDANVLLNLYQYSPATRSELLNLFGGFRLRLWLPHQAGLEFQRRRLALIFEQREKYQTLLTEFKRMLQALENTRGHPFVSPQLSKRLDRMYRDLERELTRSADELAKFQDDNPVLTALTDLFDQRLGPVFSEEEMGELKTEGERRYNQRVPPGFEDKDKPAPERYGDLIVWKQILREAESQKKGVVLINDDSKEDWWLKVKGRTIGPLPALREEFLGRTRMTFHMYPSELFMEYAANFLKRQVQREAIKEVKETRADQSAFDRLLAENQRQVSTGSYNQKFERLMEAARAGSALTEVTKALEAARVANLGSVLAGSYNQEFEKLMEAARAGSALTEGTKALEAARVGNLGSVLAGSYNQEFEKLMEAARAGSALTEVTKALEAARVANLGSTLPSAPAARFLKDQRSPGAQGSSSATEDTPPGKTPPASG